MQHATASPHLTLNIGWLDSSLSIFSGNTGLDALYCCRRAEFFHRSTLCKQAVLLKVASILMQWYMDDAIEYGEDAFRSFETFLILEIFVPQRMCQEIESCTFGRTFEKPRLEVCQ
jgi:hypothetical protein